MVQFCKVQLIPPSRISFVPQPYQLTAPIRVRPTSKTRLAAEYGVTRNTLRRWCTEINIGLSGRLLSIKEILALFAEYGAPGSYEYQSEFDLRS